MTHRRKFSGYLAFLSLLLTACAGGFAVAQEQNTVATPTPIEGSATIAEATPLPGNLDQVTFIEDNRSYTIRQLIPRDGIRPIYNPHFSSAEESTYDPRELVMGVEINSDARAYAVGILRSREMVDDEIGGTPVLVTW